MKIFKHKYDIYLEFVTPEIRERIGPNRFCTELEKLGAIKKGVIGWEQQREITKQDLLAIWEWSHSWAWAWSFAFSGDAHL